MFFSKQLSILVSLSALLLGCGAQVENYVKDRRPDIPLTTNPEIVSSPMSLKLAPGKSVEIKPFL